MQVWILTAVLAVALIGGAALAVASDGDADSDGTVVVDIDIGDVFVAPTHDAVTAHQHVQYSFIDKASGVPVFAKVFANVALNEHYDYKHRRTMPTGKPNVIRHRADFAVFEHAPPLRC